MAFERGYRTGCFVIPSPPPPPGADEPGASPSRTKHPAAPAGQPRQAAGHGGGAARRQRRRATAAAAVGQRRQRRRTADTAGNGGWRQRWWRPHADSHADPDADTDPDAHAAPAAGVRRDRPARCRRAARPGASAARRWTSGPAPSSTTNASADFDGDGTTETNARRARRPGGLAGDREVEERRTRARRWSSMLQGRVTTDPTRGSGEERFADPRALGAPGGHGEQAGPGVLEVLHQAVLLRTAGSASGRSAWPGR